MLPTVTINIDIDIPDASEFATSEIRFVLSGVDTDSATGRVVTPEPVTVQLNSVGQGTANLWPVDRGINGRTYSVTVYAMVAGCTDRRVYVLGTIQPLVAGPQSLAALLQAGVAIAPAAFYYVITQAEYEQIAGFAASSAISAAEAALYDGPKVDTFADLASVTPAMLPVGGYIRVVSLGAVYQRVASGGDLDYTGTGGVRLLTLNPSRNNPMAFGADGDGTTNDKTRIDDLNVAGTTVDLGGRDYAYTGDFVPAARFENGRIISSTLGTFDYRVTQIFGARTVTVGAGQTMTTLKAALDWLKSGIRIDGTLTLTVSGDHAVANYTFDHPDSAKLRLIGTALAGAMPTKANMVGVRATDEATILARFTASIDVGGAGDNSTGGLRVPNGLFEIENICILSNTRYSLDVGFNGAHSVSVASGKLRLRNMAVVGGVWGLIAVGAQIRIPAASSVFFAYQNTGTQPGGPVDFINCNVRIEGKYNVYSAGQASKYGLFAEGQSYVFGAQNIDIRGPFLHGIHAVDSTVIADGLTTDGVTCPVTAQPGSFIQVVGYSFSNGSVANTNTLSGAGQNGFGNNNSSANSVFFAGLGARISANAGSMTNMVAGYAFHCISGTIAHGTTAVAVDDCGWSAAFARYYTSPSNYLAANLTASKAGSLNQCIALAISTIRVGTNSGLTFSPAVNTQTNGNLFATTG